MRIHVLTLTPNSLRSLLVSNGGNSEWAGTRTNGQSTSINSRCLSIKHQQAFNVTTCEIKCQKAFLLIMKWQQPRGTAGQRPQPYSFSSASKKIEFSSVTHSMTFKGDVVILLCYCWMDIKEKTSAAVTGAAQPLDNSTSTRRQIQTSLPHLLLETSSEINWP